MSRGRAPSAIADADLPRPLGHRDQHDVHDPHAADQQRDGGDGRQHRRHASPVMMPKMLAISTVFWTSKSAGRPAGSGAAPAGAASHLFFGLPTSDSVRADTMITLTLSNFEPWSRLRAVVYGHQDDVVLVVAADVGALRLEHADDPERDVLDPHCSPIGVLAGEELRPAGSCRSRRPCWPPHVAIGEEARPLAAASCARRGSPARPRASPPASSWRCRRSPAREAPTSGVAARTAGHSSAIASRPRRSGSAPAPRAPRRPLLPRQDHDQTFVPRSRNSPWTSAWRPGRSTPCR